MLFFGEGIAFTLGLCTLHLLCYVQFGYFFFWYKKILFSCFIQFSRSILSSQLDHLPLVVGVGGDTDLICSIYSFILFLICTLNTI
jgi:hypothetical protein